MLDSAPTSGLARRTGRSRTKRGAYYSENDPYCVQWLRNLIKAGLIADGDVDDRDIRDVQPEDLEGYRQAHFFAGIGGWSYALRLAGWEDTREVWTGSCPCQPLSGAGKRKGHQDERHLWPAFHRLIAGCRPAVVFGEQVSGKDGREWLSAVRLDLDALEYAFGGADLPAAGVGAPHGRARLYWVAHADRQSAGWHTGALPGAETGTRGQVRREPDKPRDGGSACDVANARGRRRKGRSCGNAEPSHAHAPGAAGRVAHTHGRHAGAARLQRSGQHGQQPQDGGAAGVALGDASSQGPQVRSVSQEQPGPLRLQGAAFGEAEPLRGFWRGADWLWCRDGRYRPVEPGTFPLASRIPNRVGQLRAYGNSIVPQVAAAFIEAAREALALMGAGE